MKKKITKEVLEIKQAFKEKMLTFILAAFGLVAALAWNDAVQSLFNELFPKSRALIGKVIYAMLITAIVVVVSHRLERLLAEKEKEKAEKEEEKRNKAP